MTTNGTAFFTLSILCLVAIVMVFAMKYLTSGRRGKLLEKSQSETTAAIEALRQDLAQVTKRVSAVEKLLKDVE